MAHIGLISCVSTKLAEATTAKDLYASALFKKARLYIEQQCDKWFILSAKYGLVEPTRVIEPYDETLLNKSRQERAIWSERVWELLNKQLQPGDCVTILAGERYRQFLEPRLIAHGCSINVPLKGLGIGRQLQWLTSHASKLHRNQDAERFYKTLHNLEIGIGGRRILRECTGRHIWPKSGVYLFFEKGERRRETEESRIVRVGTHGVSKGSKSTLWNRLRTHRGTIKQQGNHRGSIFRLHVGAALSEKDNDVAINSWGNGQSASAIIRRLEEGLEYKVSEYIGAMSVLWLAIEDNASAYSDRAYIERNLIGMLVGKTGPVDPPSLTWLGNFSPHQRIRESGLWNLDFLDYEYSPDFLDVFDEYVLITIGKISKPTSSIAPRNWYIQNRKQAHPKQLLLFKD